MQDQQNEKISHESAKRIIKIHTAIQAIKEIFRNLEVVRHEIGSLPAYNQEQYDIIRGIYLKFGMEEITTFEDLNEIYAQLKKFWEMENQYSYGA